MKKISLLLVLTFLCTKMSFAQENCDELKTQLTDKNKTITELKNDISSLEKDIEYFKETLNLLNSEISTEIKDVEFKINTVKGNSNTGQVIVEGVLVNNGTTRSLQKHKAMSFDPQGNKIITYNMTIGGDTHKLEKLYKDVPTKFTVTFDQIVEGTPMIKLIMMDFYSKKVNTYKSDDLEVVLKNLAIEWN